MDENALAILAQMQKSMDDGAQSFVNFKGNRLLVADEDLEYFNLTPGQEIDAPMFVSINRRIIETSREIMKQRQEKNVS